MSIIRTGSAPSCVQSQGAWFPRSHFSVNGEHQPLWRVDPHNLTLHSIIAENGNRSEVWSATYVEPETGISHRTAVKKFPAPSSSDDLRNFHKEMSVMFMAASRCHHVCKVFGWCNDAEDDALCVVMKHYEQNLCTRLQSMPEGKLSLDLVQKYGRQVCIAVAELHDQNVVVADLKPQNLLLDEFDNCVVTDFGISTILSCNKDHSIENGMHGTFNYMSPEAFDPETFGGISTLTDAWSFACCICEMASGQRPWENKSMSAICYKVTSSREIPAIPDILPKRVQSALLRCFSHNRHNRPSFKELFTVFDEAWGVDVHRAPVEQYQATSKQDDLQQVEQLQAKLLTLQEEKKMWQCEREDLQRDAQDKAMKYAKLETAYEGSQAISKKLQDQLHMLVDSFKKQQEANGVGCGKCTHNELLRSQMEHQLALANDGLAQSLRQKAIAKEMLRHEEEQKRQLYLQVHQLQSLTKYIGWSLEAVAGESAKAGEELQDIIANSQVAAVQQPIHIPKLMFKNPLGDVDSLSDLEDQTAPSMYNSSNSAIAQPSHGMTAEEWVNLVGSKPNLFAPDSSKMRETCESTYSHASTPLVTSRTWDTPLPPAQPTIQFSTRSYDPTAAAHQKQQAMYGACVQESHEPPIVHYSGP